MKRKADPIAIAKKGFKTKEVKTWEQVSSYQQRGWAIVLIPKKKEGAL